MNVQDFIAATALSAEACLERLLPPSELPEARLYQAARYSLFAGGKRLRPALFMATLAALPQGLEAEPEAYLPFAAALEMIHTYSLIHDDLPAMDDDDLRRGQPTCHKAFDEATAILAGDALLTQAFAVMTRLKGQVSPTRLLEAMEEVAQAAGIAGMVAGQMVDIALAGQVADLPGLRYMVARKTGALFSAAVLSAAHLAGAEAREMAALREYSQQLGLAFQISDDILDVAGDAAKLGKPIGSDQKNHKSTFVALLGLAAARQLAEQAAAAAVAALEPLAERAELLRQFPHLLLEREH